MKRSAGGSARPSEREHHPIDRVVEGAILRAGGERALPQEIRQRDRDDFALARGRDLHLLRDEPDRVS